MKDSDLKIGLHVSIAAVDTVSRYLHGCPGIVEALNVNTDFDGTALHRISLTESRRATNHASNVVSLACRADQLEG